MTAYGRHGGFERSERRDVSNSLYITSTTIRAGKAVVALGTLETLARQVGRIGVFRPIVDHPDGSDALLTLLVELNRMGKTILVATHDLNLIRVAKSQVAARVLRIRKPSQPDAEQALLYQRLRIDWKAAFRPLKSFAKP